MSAAEQKNLTEKLRQYLLTCPYLPVKGGGLNLDALDAKGQSLSLQMEGGQAIKTYVDGSRVMRQPFSLNYRNAATKGNVEKSDMIGTLNAIGEWMLTTPLPDLGRGLRPNRIEQVILGQIIEQDNTIVGYGAQYVLEYETN